MGKKSFKRERRGSKPQKREAFTTHHNKSTYSSDDEERFEKESVTSNDGSPVYKTKVPMSARPRDVVEVYEASIASEVVTGHGRIDKIVLTTSVLQIISMLILIVANLVALGFALYFIIKKTLDSSEELKDKKIRLIYYGACGLAAVFGVGVGTIGVLAATFFPNKDRAHQMTPRRCTSMTHMVLLVLITIGQAALALCIFFAIKQVFQSVSRNYAIIFVSCVVGVASLILIGNALFLICSIVRYIFVKKQDSRLQSIIEELYDE